MALSCTAIQKYEFTNDLGELFPVIQNDTQLTANTQPQDRITLPAPSETTKIALLKYNILICCRSFWSYKETFFLICTVEKCTRQVFQKIKTAAMLKCALWTQKHKWEYISQTFFYRKKSAMLS